MLSPMIWFAITLLIKIWTPCFVLGGSCPPNTLVTYDLHLETLWHRKDFPKHYPQWRPPASWSKMIGFTHEGNFSLFHKGQEASDALKQFLKSNQYDLFDQHTQGNDGVFDQFTVPSIKTGVGEAKLKFTANFNHTKISLLSKLLPSPDWFIGVDSYDLCPDGTWLQYVHLEVTPLDGGTDNGLTFSSPEWPTVPREKIRAITSNNPSHPAGSFNYPELDDLPPIAQFTMKKEKEYSLNDASSLKETGHYVPGRRDIYRYEVADAVQAAQMDDSSVNILPEDAEDRSKNEIPTSSRSERRKKHHFTKKERDIYRKKTKRQRVSATSPNPVTEVTEPDQRRQNSISRTLAKPSSALRPNAKQKFSNGSQIQKGRRRIPGGDVMSVIDDIVKDYQKEHREMIRKRKKQRRRRRQQLKKIRPPRDCRVSDWSEWSSCSKTCGIGEQSRTRAVIKHARRGGRPCPILVETTWCGSARSCKRKNYFNWAA